ncbi:hypothetical protein HDV63DRAFT_387220 [Trichoderma sp. SZMC 28014]
MVVILAGLGAAAKIWMAQVLDSRDYWNYKHREPALFRVMLGFVFIVASIFFIDTPA